MKSKLLIYTLQIIYSMTASASLSVEQAEQEKLIWWNHWLKDIYTGFYKIILCGNRNRLLEFPETKNITVFYGGNSDDCGIYDPFKEMGSYELQKNKKENNKNLLIVFDDQMESVYKSPTVSRIFSKGRHYSISCVVLLQSYFP